MAYAVLQHYVLTELRLDSHPRARLYAPWFAASDSQAVKQGATSDRERGSDRARAWSTEQATERRKRRGSKPRATAACSPESRLLTAVLVVL